MADVTIFSTEDKYSSNIEKTEKVIVSSFRYSGLPHAHIEAVTIKKAPACYKDTTIIKLSMHGTECENLLRATALDIMGRAELKDVFIEITPQKMYFKNGKQFRPRENRRLCLVIPSH